MTGASGEYMEVLRTEPGNNLVSVMYRKVSNCSVLYALVMSVSVMYQRVSNCSVVCALVMSVFVMYWRVSNCSVCAGDVCDVSVMYQRVSNCSVLCVLVMSLMSLLCTGGGVTDLFCGCW